MLLCSFILQFQFVALAVDAIDGCGPSNKMHCQSQPKKTMVMLYWPFI